MMTVLMPNERAREQACWPPAPPNEARMCFEALYPRASVSARMGRHMISFATRMKPCATSSTESCLDWEELALISSVSFWKAS